MPVKKNLVKFAESSGQFTGDQVATGITKNKMEGESKSSNNHIEEFLLSKL